MSFALAGRINNLEADTDARLDAIEASIGSDIVTAAKLASQFSLSGGGTVSWSSTRLKWSGRVSITPIQRTLALDGHYYVICPSDGTAISYYGAGSLVSNVFTTTQGIPIGVGQSLYWRMPTTPTTASDSAWTYLVVVDVLSTAWTSNSNHILIATCDQ